MFIPKLLSEKIESLFPNERRTSLRKSKTYNFLSEMFSNMQVNENRISNNVFLFQFPFSKMTLQKRFTNSFYKDVFTKKMKADPKEVNYETALVQSNGSYLARSYPYSYRINPKYLGGELVPIPNVEITRDPDYSKIRGRKFKKTAKWHTHFMKALFLNKEYADHIRTRHYHFEYRMVNIDKLNVRVYFLTKGNNERIELFNQLRSSKSTFLESTLKIRIDHYYVYNKKEAFEDTMGLESVISAIQWRQNTGKIKPDSAIILYQGSLYVDSSIEAFLDSVHFSFQLRTQYHQELINRKISNFSVSYTNGRVFNNLTSINKHYLNGLLYLIDSESCFLSTLDLKNAQPTILANLILRDPTFIKSIQSSEQKNLRLNLERFLKFESKCESAMTFLQMCVSGKLYETIQQDYLLKSGLNLNRDFFKVEMLRVMFSKPNYYSNFIDLETRFPGLEKYLRDLKLHMGYNENGKNNLALLLQGTESFIFVETVYYSMAVQGIPGTTKHDCLIVPRDKDLKYIVATQDLVNRVFTELNFKGLLSLENTVLKIFEYPHREEYNIDLWDDKQSEVLSAHYMRTPFFKGLK